MFFVPFGKHTSEKQKYNIKGIIEQSHLQIQSCERAFCFMRDGDLYVGVFAFLKEHLPGSVQELQNGNIFGHRKMSKNGISGKEEKKIVEV